jgi:hypothetical protein
MKAWCLGAAIALALGGCGSGITDEQSPAVTPASRQLRAPLVRATVAAVQTPLQFATLVSWAPSAFPQYFHGVFVDGETNVPGVGDVVYRRWTATGDALGIANGNVYFAGPDTGGQVQLVGALASYRCAVFVCDSGSSAKAVFPTSYENKNAIDVDPGFPTVWDPSMDNIRFAEDASEQGFNPRSLSFGDFLRNGTYGAFVVSTRSTSQFPADDPLKWADTPGYAYFLSRGPNGQWYDVTASLLPNPADRVTCITPTYSLVADFNNDGRPDVYVTCTGIDFTVGGLWTSDQISEQHLFLSQADGTYQHVVLPIGRIYGHQATAFDIDGDGNVDILTVDPYVNRTPFVLWGHGDGTFTQDLTRLPADMSGKYIYDAVAIPVAGKNYVVVSGNTPGSMATLQATDYGTKVLRYQDGKFQYVMDLTASLPDYAPGRKFGLGLDHVFANGFLYSYHVSPDYSVDGVTKTDPATGHTELVYQHTITGPGQELIEIAARPDGMLGVFGAVCNQYDPPGAICAVRIAP